MCSVNEILLASLYFVSVITSSGCNNYTKTNDSTNTIITKISYATTGGRSGNYESLDISADSLIYLQARHGDEKIIKEKTAKDFWSNLTKTINLKDFDKIKSNPGHALYDGIDVTLSIEKKTEKHSVVNGSEDTLNYSRIRPFTG